MEYLVDRRMDVMRSVALFTLFVRCVLRFLREALREGLGDRFGGVPDDGAVTSGSRPGNVPSMDYFFIIFIFFKSWLGFFGGGCLDSWVFGRKRKNQNPN